MMLFLGLLFASPQTESQSPPPPPQKVLMIGLDGVRPDALQAARTPHLDALSERGAITYTGQTTAITSSGPAWSSILTGARVSLHNVRNNAFEGKKITTWPTWLAQWESAHPEAFTAAVSQWGPIHDHLTQGTIDLSLDAEDQAAVTASALKIIGDSENDVTALFLHYDGGDHAGHAHGYGVNIPEYLAAIESVDAEVGKVLQEIRRREQILHEDWLILVGTDHGGTGTSHGKNIPEHRTVFLIASGSSAEDFSWRKNAEVVDFAPAALHHLGLQGSCIPAPRKDGWWQGRHAELNRRALAQTADILFLGDSITQGWEGAGKNIWKEFYGNRKAINLGIGGDKTEHVLWRLRHGNLENQNPRVCVIMIGTNNSNRDSSDAITKGVQAIVAELQFSVPESEILLLATFPRGATVEDRLRKINEASNASLREWSNTQEKVHHIDFNVRFLTETGVLTQEVMPDLLHPHEAGYKIWATAMEEELKRLLAISE